jgi:VWFA-related protein
MSTTRVRRGAFLAGAALLLVLQGALDGVRAQGGGQEPAAPAAQQPAPADQPPADPGQPVFRTGISFVRVDVIVTDKQGQPVTDLTQADFEVQEDNKPQTVETFRLVKIETANAVVPPSVGRIRSRDDEERAAQNEDARIFVFFLDDYHVRLGNSMSARQHLVKFVEGLGPNDLLAVMYPMTPLDAVTLTRDHASVIRMLERFQGRKFDYTPRNSIEEKYMYQPTEVIEVIRRQVALSALEGLSVKLGALREGRKGIILVSEGFTGVLPPQLRDANAQMPGLGNPARGNPMAGVGDINEDRAQFRGQLDVQEEMRLVWAAANRSNTAIYAVDPRGLSTGEYDIQDNVSFQQSTQGLNQSMDTLRILASETDGRAIVNRNDLAKGMEQIVRDNSAYYLLGYNSTQAATDGKFHAIKVRVKRPGLQVRARRGYWAFTAEDARRATAGPRPAPPPAVTKSLAAIADPNRRPIRSWIGTGPGPDGKTRVTYVWEPVANQVGAVRAAAAPSHVDMIAAAVDGGTLYYRGRVGGPDGAATGSADGGAPGPPAGSGGRVVLDVPPGPMELKLSIEDAGSVVIDSEERTIEVPDFSAPATRLSTPRVHVGRTAREVNALKANPDALPTTVREFRRTERLLLRFEARTPGGVAPTLAARLLNKGGDRLADIPVTAAPAPDQPYTIDLPLANLPVGEFLLEVVATAEGSEPAKELVAFRMIP